MLHLWLFCLNLRIVRSVFTKFYAELSLNINVVEKHFFLIQFSFAHPLSAIAPTFTSMLYSICMLRLCALSDMRINCFVLPQCLPRSPAAKHLYRVRCFSCQFVCTAVGLRTDSGPGAEMSVKVFRFCWRGPPWGFCGFFFFYRRCTHALTDCGIHM